MAQLTIFEARITGPGLKRMTGKLGNVTFKLRARKGASMIMISARIPREVPVSAFSFTATETADVRTDAVRTGRIVSFSFTGWVVTGAVRQLISATTVHDVAQAIAPFTSLVAGIRLDT